MTLRNFGVKSLQDWMIDWVSWALKLIQSGENLGESAEDEAEKDDEAEAE